MLQTRALRPAAGLAAILAPAVLAACSGSSGGAPARTIAFVAGTSTTTEGAAHAVGVRINLRDGPLLADASVLVSDAGTGSAAAGSDYPAFAPTSLVFPMGTTDGTILNFALSASADSSVEGPEETVRLTLSSPVGAGLGGRTTHLVEFADGDVASVAFAADASATPDESDGARPIGVQLDLEAGDQLAVDVDVLVSDTRTGSATSGPDYAPFPALRVSFPAGSADGATSTVFLDVRGDEEVETDETVIFSLSAPSVGAVLGVQGTHALTISEDDQSPFPFVAVFADGDEVASGADLAFGGHELGAGASAPIVLEVRNLGATPLPLSTLTMTGDFGEFLLDLDLGESLAPAAEPEDLTFPIAARLGHRPLQGEVLELDPLAIDALAAAGPRVRLHGLPGLDSELVLELERVRSPWSAAGQIYVDGVAVPGGPGALLDDLSLWQGSVAGRAGSTAFFAFSRHGSRGWVRSGPDELLHLVAEPERAGSRPLARLVSDQDLELAGRSGPPALCDAALSVPGSRALAGPGALPPAGLSVGFDVATCRLAVETDYQFHQLFGTTQAAAAYATGLLAAVSATYEAQAETVLSVEYLGLHSLPTDPWSAQDSGGDAGDVLAEFQAAWAPSSWPAAADLAHFLSGAGVGGGIAYVDVLCNPSFGFGVSGNLSGDIDWDSFNGAPSSLNWDFVVVAHELGHNFGALHTHDYCPPLDHCQANCESTTGCPQGTLMSYCHLCGGMANILPEFHPHVANGMRQRAGESCIGDSSLAPGGTARFQVRFDPSGSPGLRSAVLRFEHGADNAASPFRLDLFGTATN
jgi:hypothetical protein